MCLTVHDVVLEIYNITISLYFVWDLQHSETEMFNAFLRELKNDLIGTRYVAFWDNVVSAGVTLISKTESGDSTVTPEEAKEVKSHFSAFLELKICVVSKLLFIHSCVIVHTVY